MADPTLEEVAKSWASWVTGDIIDDLAERDTLPTGYLDDVREVIMKHLVDVAISNASRATATTTDMAARSGGCRNG